MKVEVIVMSESGRTTPVEVKHDLGVRIHHNGKSYQISEDNSGSLVLRSLLGSQLIVKPSSSNGIKIECEL